MFTLHFTELHGIYFEICLKSANSPFLPYPVSDTPSLSRSSEPCPGFSESVIQTHVTSLLFESFDFDNQLRLI
jgi:hypothetical protein